MLENLSQKIPELFECKNCDYATSSKKDFNKHILTLKHKKLVNASNMLVNETKTNTFVCCCGKSYFHDSSYYRHKKKCNYIDDTKKIEEMMNDKELIQYLLKENSEFKQLMIDQNKQMIELAKNSGNNNNNNNTTNNNQQSTI